MFISLTKGITVGTDTIAAMTWSPKAVIGTAHPAGDVELTPEQPSSSLVFALSRDAPIGDDILGCAPVEMPDGPAMFRVDEVCFPVGAVAHRHSHKGSGLRHLIRGALRIEAEDHTQVMTVGDTWFEAVSAPVRAVSLHDQGVTSFVRGMVIPAAYEGKSTYYLMDPADAELPRLQVTHRHIDLPIQLDAG